MNGSNAAGSHDGITSPSLSPSRVQNLLKAGMTGATARLRHWEPPSVAELQRLLPQYEITAFLARGGMGAVYQAIQPSLGRVVAIKILPPDVVDDHVDYPARFKREARAMAALTHPNIVSVYEAGETPEGLLFFAMEYVEGTDVAQRIAERGGLFAQEAREIILAVLAALEWAHSHGVIHRDIKPANVLVRHDGVIKVADFGLARLADADVVSTQTEVIVGTPEFIPPEVRIPGIAIDHRADLFSCGVMLYQMLTGRLPHGRYDPPSHSVPGLNRRWDRIVDQAMSADRDSRYASAAGMRAAVEALRTAGTPWALRSILSHRRILATSLTAAFCAGSVVWWGVGHSNPGRSVATPQSPKAAGPLWSRMPTDEEKKQAFTNSLGMRFVPVPGTDVLFCVHETRRQDYAAYAAANSGVDGTWQYPPKYQGVAVSFADDHPVVEVNLDDAKGFCAWLSTKEGRKYRLPTDHEWSCAAGIGEFEGAPIVPRLKSDRLFNFAWGTQWPPPRLAGNLGDESLRRGTGQEPVIDGYDDGYVTTAPVMSLQPNPLGIYDLSGNVWEVCPDEFDSRTDDVVGRGSSFNNGNPNSRAAYVAINIRNPRSPYHRSENSGFRVVADKRTP